MQALKYSTGIKSGRASLDSSDGFRAFQGPAEPPGECYCSRYALVDTYLSAFSECELTGWQLPRTDTDRHDGPGDRGRGEHGHRLG